MHFSSFTLNAAQPLHNLTWSSLKPDVSGQGENAWVFIPEEDINATVKHFLKFEAEMFSEAKKVAAKGTVVKKPTELSFIIMDNKLLTVEEVSAGNVENSLGRGDRSSDGGRFHCANLASGCSECSLQARFVCAERGGEGGGKEHVAEFRRNCHLSDFQIMCLFVEGHVFGKTA